MRPHHITVIEIIAFRIGNIESVLHLPRRVVSRHIQGVKIMELVFDIRPFGNRKAHLPENSDNLFVNLRNRVQTPLIFRPNRQSYVNRFRGQPVIKLLGFQNSLLRRQSFFNFPFQNIEGLAHGNLFFLRKRSQRFHHLGNLAFFSKNCHPGLFQRFHVCGPVNLRYQFSLQIFCIFHFSPEYSSFDLTFSALCRI